LDQRRTTTTKVKGDLAIEAPRKGAKEDRIRAEEGNERERGEIEETKRGGSSARYRGGEVEVGGYQRGELKERSERENEETQDRAQAELEQERSQLRRVEADIEREREGERKWDKILSLVLLKPPLSAKTC
jgi:hypothetical protein